VHVIREVQPMHVIHERCKVGNQPIKEATVGKKRLRRLSLLVSVAIVAGAATAFGDLSSDFRAPAAPVLGHGTYSFLQMTGAQTGKFTGGVTTTHFEGAIQLLALDMPSSGAGAYPCSGIEFRELTNEETPKVFAAANRGEQITKAVFSETRASGRAAPEVTLRITAENARITSVHHVNSTTSGWYDDVVLAPTTVTIAYVPSRTSTTYSCLNT
jgi:type VI protein secretion system component Hcp